MMLEYFENAKHNHKIFYHEIMFYVLKQLCTNKFCNMSINDLPPWRNDGLNASIYKIENLSYKDYHSNDINYALYATDKEVYYTITVYKHKNDYSIFGKANMSDDIEILRNQIREMFDSLFVRKKND